MSFENAVMNSSKITTGIKFGFLGLGMGGNSIAAACADITTNIPNNKNPYSALLINTNKMDLQKVEVSNPSIRKLLIGDGNGSARSMERGEQFYVESEEIIEEAIKKQFKDTEFLWIVAGLGGGTGTGTIVRAMVSAMNAGFQNNFGLILTLPRDFESLTVISNAIKRLQFLYERMTSKKLGSIILVDNQKLYNEYNERTSDANEVKEYLDFTNRYVAETIHEMNIVTASFTPTTNTHFDTSELNRLIRTPGILHLSKFSKPTREVSTATSASHANEFKENIVKGVLSDGYDLKRSIRAALSILSNSSSGERMFNFGFTNAIETVVNDLTPVANEKPIAYYNYNYKNVSDTYFYSVFAGLGLPDRIDELIDEVIRISEAKKEILQPEKSKFDRFNTLDDELDDMSEDNSMSAEDILGINSDIKKQDKIKAFNPLDLLDD